jgi:hypothetical protein
MPDLSNLAKKAQRAIAGALEPTETVLVSQPGESAALVATNRRILISKWGAATGHLFSAQLNSWDFAHVTGIEYRKGMTTKAIVVQTAGAQVVTEFGRMGKGPASVWEAPNALFVAGDEGEGTVAFLRQIIADHHHSAGGSTAAASSGADPAEQIRKFAALRDDGLISPEEFEAKKRSLLGL